MPKPVQQKRYEAELRRLARASRTEAEQLSCLNKRLGKGVGAKRERARLAPASRPKRSRKTRAV